MREMILDEGRRLDGRKTDEIRDIWTEVDYLPKVHGSAVFTRGETQTLVMVTLGTGRDVQAVDQLFDQTDKRFYLHYSFPPFSVGETKFLRGPSRREIGHGMLAERALSKVMPGEEEFPYTVRIISDVLESNGSSSMASVCGASLALMEAGHLDQILVSQDICRKSTRVRYGGWGYPHILNYVVPMMRQRGFGQEQIDTILSENPKRIFCFV